MRVEYKEMRKIKTEKNANKCQLWQKLKLITQQTRDAAKVGIENGSGSASVSGDIVARKWLLLATIWSGPPAPEWGSNQGSTFISFAFISFDLISFRFWPLSCFRFPLVKR